MSRLETARWPSRPGLLTMLLASGCLLALGACGSDAAPGPVADGDYRAFAVPPGEMTVPEASVEIRGPSILVRTRGEVAETRLGSSDDTFLLCPPNGEGTPLPLDRSLRLAEVEFSRPAIFGDCGQTRPLRITLVDLDSYVPGEGAPPFTRWIEFCDVTDPDC